MGRREENLRRAVLLIGERVGEVLRQSSVLETEPWRYESDNKFLNAVILCQTELSPRQLLQAVKQIERDMGRVTKSKACRYAETL
jgi:2-amino-4-hydroxy-6-hydroxymethyldihydropteridine diphosphokinase